MEELEAFHRLRKRLESWLPIESAPKDGKYLLLGWFLEHGGGGPPAVAWWSEAEQVWVAAGGRRLRGEGYFSPTHWCPLPTDPRD